MANLQKKTKTELVMLCNERGSEIERLRKEAEENQTLIEKLNEDCDTLNRRYRSLEADFKGNEESSANKIKEINTTYSKEVQSLQDKITIRDKTIVEQSNNYKELKNDFDKLRVDCENISARCTVFKLLTIVFIVAFIIALICACI